MSVHRVQYAQSTLPVCRRRNREAGRGGYFLSILFVRAARQPLFSVTYVPTPDLSIYLCLFADLLLQTAAAAGHLAAASRSISTNIVLPDCWRCT